MKKEHRKADPHVVEALGPALFSTPDIIRRVGSTESKIPESPVATTPTTPSPGVSNTSISAPVVSAVDDSTVTTPSSSTAIPSMDVQSILDEPMETNISANDSTDDALVSKIDANISILSESLEDDKIDSKTAIAELLQPALDSGKYNNTIVFKIIGIYIY